ncbi:hypothetical protein ElyMa_001417900 [Elysia marginata]|uniref:MADF domain-containing protein n=1 Tax=Elysia marginata TaxID=1093978 RepID=A0AAV4IXP8_9GAST|nr:hypothetical protein ElyMa_001417900 [Elysia marginata]
MIGSTEAVWRLFEYSMHERFPSVVQLAVHLQNGQRVYFTEQTADEIARREPPFFKLCHEDLFAKNLMYNEAPRFYTWDSSKKEWKRRKRGEKVEGEDICETQTIGRVSTVSPRQGECFFLRILIHKVKGPTSFDDLKTVNGLICYTFREACQLQGLMDNDNAWFSTMQEVCLCSSPHALRSLPAIIITQCIPSDGRSWWDHEATLNFFKAYQSAECLWKIKSKDYCNKYLKEKAYENLVKLCQEFDPCVIKDTIAKKVNNVRTSFRRKLKKKENSKMSGAGTDNVYEPKLWYFDHLVFLTDEETPRQSFSNIPVYLDRDVPQDEGLICESQSNYSTYIEVR